MDQAERIRENLKIEQWVKWKEFTEVVLKRSSYNHQNFGFSSQRLGQYLVNELHYYHPLLAHSFRFTKFDPFYNDDIVPVFLEKCDELWEKI